MKTGCPERTVCLHPTRHHLGQDWIGLERRLIVDLYVIVDVPNVIGIALMVLTTTATAASPALLANSYLRAAR